MRNNSIGFSRGEWEGLLIAPFAGLSLPNPGDAAIWTGNIFNTEAGAVWAWTSGAYNNTKVFGTVKFSRRAPVIRPDNPVVQNNAISVPVTIRALNAGGRFEATLDFYSTCSTFFSTIRIRPRRRYRFLI